MKDQTEKKWRLAFILILLAACLWAGRNGGGGDFFVLRKSVMAAWNGSFSKVYIKESSGPFFYPPFALVFFGVFAWIGDEHVAILINILLHTLSYVGFWWGLRQCFPNLFLKGNFKKWFLCFCFSIAPLHLDFMGQNINLPLAALVILIETQRRKNGRNNLFFVGFCSALVAWIKMFPALVTVTYFLIGEREIRKGILAGTIAGFLLPMLCFGQGGMELYRYFAEVLFVYHDKNGIAGSYALNLPGLLARWGSLLFPTAVARFLTIAIPTAVLGLFGFWLIKNQENKSQEWKLEVWALTVALMVFLNSASRPDYFMFYVPLFAALMAKWVQLNRFERWLLLASFVFIAMTQQAIVGKELNIDIQHARIPVVGMALLIISQFSCLLRRTKEVS